MAALVSATGATANSKQVAPTLLPARHTIEISAFPGAPPLPRRIVMSRLPDPPAGSAEKLVDALLPIAEGGNTTAAYELALVLGECERVPTGADELDRRIADIKRTRIDVDTRVRYPRQMEKDLRRRFERCRDVSAAQRDTYYDWLRRAADGGLLDALENFSLFTPPGDICREYEFSRCSAEQQAASRAAREVIGHYLLAARDAGSVNALWQLGAAYRQGELFPTDDTAAYAHLLAYERAVHALGAADRVAAEVKSLSAHLSADAREKARQQARALLANPNCCVLIR
jgi:hypothetical protein